jgi:ABC-2 type transport system ATP-binding protein
MISIENLKKYYGDFPAVDDISFTVQTGEILGFLGPNGAGKTTTMKVITGYYPPTAGRVTVNDRDVVTDSLETRQMIGYLPESTPLYLDLTVSEYLHYIAELRQIPEGERAERIDRITTLTGLTDRMQQPIGQLSKGYRQRVGLAQAMVHDPDILILDEPTIGLDPNQIVEIRSLIREIGREKTVILSTHILPEVQATCDRVVIINEGKIVADGTPDELQSRFEGQAMIDLLVTGEGSDDPDAFQQVHGVVQVEKMPAPEPNVNRFQIMAEQGTDPRGELFRLCVKKEWTLLGMTRKIQSLEDIFQQLTRSDAAHQGREEEAA